MRLYVMKRVMQMIPVLFIASIGTWAIAYALPGSPAFAIAGGYNAPPAQIAAVTQRLGLDRPLYLQYFIWLKNTLHGDLGTSIISGQPVFSLLVDRIPASAQLAVASVVVGLAVALPLGVVAALRPGSWADRFIRGYEALGLAIPTFLCGLMLIWVFGVELQWLPGISAYVPFWQGPIEAIRYTALPALTIGFNISAVLARFVTAAMSKALLDDYVQTARAKGIREGLVVRRHAFRNALLPTVTIVGISLASLLGGTVITEVVFNYPGVGRLIYTAVINRDYPIMQAGILFIVVLFLTLNLAVDVLYAALDPRIRVY